MISKLDQALASMAKSMDKDNYGEASKYAQAAIEYLEMKSPDSSESQDWDRRALLDMLYSVKEAATPLIESANEFADIGNEVIPICEGDGILIPNFPVQTVPDYSEEEKTALIDLIVNGSNG